MKNSTQYWISTLRRTAEQARVDGVDVLEVDVIEADQIANLIENLRRELDRLNKDAYSCNRGQLYRKHILARSVDDRRDRAPWKFEDRITITLEGARERCEAARAQLRQVEQLYNEATDRAIFEAAYSKAEQELANWEEAVELLEEQAA